MGFTIKSCTGTKCRITKRRILTPQRKCGWNVGPELDPKILCFVWLAGACLLWISIFATENFSGSAQLQMTSFLSDEKELRVTIFTAPAPFEGTVGIRQEVAIDSWLRLAPSPNVVLFGQHSSIHWFAAKRTPHVTVDDDIDFTFSGKPLFHGMMQKALSSFTEVVVLIDPDLVVLQHVMSALRTLQRLDQDWLMAALPLTVPDFPFSLQGKGFKSFGAEVDDEEVEAYILDNGIMDACEGPQLWAWNGNKKPLHAGVMPPFVYGEGRHNHWLLAEALRSKSRVVLDASEAINVFRTQGSNSSYDSDHRSLVDQADADKLSSFDANTWLASTYGSYHFKPLNFSDIQVKLLKCSGFKLKFCMVLTSQNTCFCPPLETMAAPGRMLSAAKLQEIWCLFTSPSKWNLLFERLLVGWIGTKHVWKYRDKAASNACDYSYSEAEEKMVLLVEKKVQSNKNAQCRDSQPAGSERRNSKLSFSLPWLLSRVANENKVVILAVVGNSYRDMLMSWVCRLRHLHIANFLVSALDDEIHHFASVQGLPVFRSRLDTNVSRNDCHFGTECFQQVTKMKSRIVLQVLQLGFHVLFSDVDIYWFQDPLEELMNFGPGHFTAQTDQWNETEPLNQPRHLNSGFYFAWADDRTVAAFEKIIKHASSSKKSEQPSFYDVLCGVRGAHRVGNNLCIEPHLNLTVHFLDPMKYPNGAYRALWEKQNVTSACMEQGCRILHNNWIPGRQKKLDRQIAAGLWDYDVSTRMCIASANQATSDSMQY